MTLWLCENIPARVGHVLMEKKYVDAWATFQQNIS